MKDKKHKHSHICAFTKKSKVLDSLFPPTTRFRTLRKKFRECMLVSEENGRKCHTSQGSAGYFFEKEKQLTQHYYMIHPYSKFREYWEVLVVTEIFFSLVIRSFYASQYSNTTYCSFAYQIPALLTDVFELFDVGLSFITGYVDKETQAVVLEKEKILHFNLQRAYFLCNIISSLPLEFILFLATMSSCSENTLAYVTFIKITKLGLISKYLIHFAKIHRWSELCLRSVWVIVNMFLLAHWVTCLFYLVIYTDEYGPSFGPHESELERHLTIFHMIAMTFFFQNGISSHLTRTNPKDYFFCTLVLIVVDMSNIVFMGLFIQLLGLMKTPLIQYEKMVQEVEKFLMQENLPKRVHEKVIKYFQFRFRYRYFREKIILETLSPPMRQEIANYLCKGLLLHPDSIFVGIPDSLTNALCLKMKFEVFLAGDVIIRAGRKASKIYFIYCGSAVMYSPHGKELSHLYTGHQFDEAAFLPDSRHAVTVISLETSEYYVLYYRDFMECAEDYEEAKELVAKAAQEKRNFFSDTKQLMQDPKSRRLSFPDSLTNYT